MLKVRKLSRGLLVVIPLGCLLIILGVDQGLLIPQAVSSIKSIQRYSSVLSSVGAATNNDGDQTSEPIGDGAKVSLLTIQTDHYMRTHEQWFRMTRELDSSWDDAVNQAMPLRMALIKARDQYGADSPEARALEKQTPDFLSIGEQLKPLKEKVRELAAKRLQLASEISKLLPSIDSTAMKINCIYRGTLMRRLALRHIKDNVFEVLNMELERLVFEGVANFTHVQHPQVAMNYALNGCYQDPVRDRVDAVVIEVEYNQEIAGVTRLDYDDPDYPYNLLPSEGLRGREVRLYRPIRHP